MTTTRIAGAASCLKPSVGRRGAATGASLLLGVCLAAGTQLSAFAAAPAPDSATIQAEIASEVGADYPHLDALYKDIHAHPELGFQEVRTAARLAREMRDLGFTVTEHVGKTGVVAIYRNGPGPQVLVRTELDGLPMEEKTGLPYASRATATWEGKQTFTAHSCGHDIHMAVWVGTAKALLAQKSRWTGTLMFVAQPAEETVHGARTMLDDGLFTRFGKPDYGFALHVGPLPAGEIRYKSGVVTSNSEGLALKFTGRGAHGSTPNLSIDPVMMAAHFIVDVQSVVSREKDPAAFGVLTIGAVEAGSAENIIPDAAVLRGTIRTYDQAVQERINLGVQRTAAAVASMAGASAPELHIEAGARAVMNDEVLVQRTGAVFKAAFSEMAGLSSSPSTASEDYSEFQLAGVPSVFFNLGALDPKQIAEAKAKGEPPPGNHSPYFAPTPEPTIKAGVTAMTLAVMNVALPTPWR